MAYNSNKGNQHMGDVQYEGDPNDVQIDFENDFVAIKTNGQQRFIVSGSAITASVDITGSGDLSVTGRLTADGNNFRVFDNAVRANDFRTPTTRIDSTHISSSLNISGAAFYGDGSNLNLGTTGVSADSYTYTALTVDSEGRVTAASSGTPPALTSISNQQDNRIITSAGTGQANAEANLTFNAFNKLSVQGDVSASLGITGSSVRTETTVIDTLHLSSSLNISGAAFYANGVELIQSPISVYDDSGNNRVITSVDGNAVQGEPNLTFDGSQLSVTGDVSGSGTLQAVGATTLGSNLSVSGNINVGGQNLANSLLYVQAPSDNTTLAFFKSPSNETIFAVTGSGKVAIGGGHLDATLNISGSDADLLLSAKGDTVNPAFSLRGNGDASISGSLVVSGSVRGQVLDMHTHKANIATSARHYVRFDGAGADSVLGFNNFMVTTYNGKLIKVVARANSAAGSSVMSFHRGTDGDTNIDAVAVESITVNMSAVRTAYTFNFTDTSDWAAGDIVGLSFSGSSSPGNIVFHSVWEMDQNS